MLFTALLLGPPVITLGLSGVPDYQEIAKDRIAGADAVVLLARGLATRPREKTGAAS